MNKKELIPGGYGYRVEEYQNSKVTNAIEILRHEIFEMGNTGDLTDAAKALKVNPIFGLVVEAIEKKFGRNATGLWLTTKKGAKTYSHTADGTGFLGDIQKYYIPLDAVKLIDLGDTDGAFFVFRGKKEEYLCQTITWTRAQVLDELTDIDEEFVAEEFQIPGDYAEWAIGKCLDCSKQLVKMLDEIHMPAEVVRVTQNGDPECPHYIVEIPGMFLIDITLCQEEWDVIKEKDKAIPEIIIDEIDRTHSLLHPRLLKAYYKKDSDVLEQKIVGRNIQ